MIAIFLERDFQLGRSSVERGSDGLHFGSAHRYNRVARSNNGVRSLAGGR